MAAISHLIRVDRPLGDTFSAITDNESIAHWFTETICDDWSEGSEVIWFGGTKMIVSEIAENKVVGLHVQSGSDWTGTDIVFATESLGPSRSVVRFDHKGWDHVDDHFRDCSLSWAYFLQSLKAFLETGTGTPESASPACEAS